MDQHPPSWVGNGTQFLTTVGVASPTMSRLTLSRPTEEVPNAVDCISLARGLVENFSLREMELYRCNVSTQDFDALAQALSVNKYLEYLNLARNPGGAHGTDALAEALKVNQTLRHLDLSWSGVTDEGAAALAEALLVNNSLQRLSLDRNAISCDGAGAIATAVSSNRKLKYLSLSRNQIKAAGLSFLARAVASSRTLTTLDVSANGIAEPGVFSLFHALAHAGPKSALLTLNVAFNNVGASVAMVGVFLDNRPGLRELNMESCGIAAGTHFDRFASAVGRNKTLANLNISSNAIGDAGLKSLVGPDGALNVRHLDVSDCSLTADGANALLRLVEGSKTLETLHVHRNRFGPTAGTVLGQLQVVRGSALSFLGASRCGLGQAGVEKMAQQLRLSPPTVNSLSLRENEMGDIGFGALCPAMSHFRTYRFLDISRNGCGPESLRRLPDVFESNASLPYVAFDDDTVITRDNMYQAWEDLNGRSPAPMSLPPPPHTCAAHDIDPTWLKPSTGFGTYSVAIGSALKRHSEGSPSCMSQLIELAGHPVKHTAVWAGPSFAKTAPKLCSARYNSQISSSEAVEMENNLGGLLITDDQLRREFNRLDVNGSGYLEAEEMKNIYSSLEHFGVKYTQHDLDWLVREAGDGERVSFDQFCVLYLKLVRA
jgi:Ran GTPase-activating protein (RanGAP) involved in mRNA processing and transport